MTTVKYTLLFLPMLIWAGCGSGEEPEPTVSPSDQFFERVTTHCGETYQGTSVFPDDPEHDLYGARLQMTVRDCSDDEIRIPFQVDEDRSRTWILTRTDQGLLLKHDHRDPDTGVAHELTNYGGYSNDQGGPSRQYFPADRETAEMLPEAATNVWMMELDEEGGRFIYDLERHEAPRYRAEFLLEP